MVRPISGNIKKHKIFMSIFMQKPRFQVAFFLGHPVATCCLLLATCYLLFATCYFRLVTLYLLLPTCCLLIAIFYLLLDASYYLLPDTYHLILATWIENLNLIKHRLTKTKKKLSSCPELGSAQPQHVLSFFFRKSVKLS